MTATTGRIIGRYRQSIHGWHVDYEVDGWGSRNPVSVFVGEHKPEIGQQITVTTLGERGMVTEVRIDDVPVLTR